MCSLFEQLVHLMDNNESTSLWCHLCFLEPHTFEPMLLQSTDRSTSIKVRYFNAFYFIGLHKLTLELEKEESRMHLLSPVDVHGSFMGRSSVTSVVGLLHRPLH